MTDKPTPTDVELKTLWQLHAADIGGIFHYARAALAKWGTPAPVEVGEVAEHYRNAIASACEGWTMPDGLRKHLETALWSPPTPQPTQAQAAEPVAWLSPWRKDQVTTDYDAYGKQGIPLVVAQQPVAREPLDEARHLFDAGWKACANFCDRDDVVADGIIGFGACPQFEAALSAAQPVAREPLTDEQIKALMQAHRTAMLMTCKAQVPECGEFAAIAQDLDWLCESFGIKGGQHGTE